MRTQQRRQVKIVATVELVFDMDVPEEILLQAVDDGEMDIEDAAAGGFDSEISRLVDIAYAKEELVGELVKIKSGSFDNMVYGEITDILSAAVETVTDDEPCTAA